MLQGWASQGDEVSLPRVRAAKPQNAKRREEIVVMVSHNDFLDLLGWPMGRVVTAWGLVE